MIELTIEQDALERIDSALAAEEGGAKLRRDFGRNLRDAIEPALPLIRTELMAMPSSRPADAEPPLRTSVLAKMKTTTRFSGSSPGVRVAIGRTPELRGFESAARRINRGSWSHPVYGREGTSVEQAGSFEFFDRPLNDRRAELRAAVVEALEDMAQRIARGA